MRKPETHTRDALDALASCRLATPSPTLKRRVMRAAQEAWTPLDASAVDVPWARPMLQLAASLIVAALLIGFAERMNRLAVEPWQPLARSQQYRATTTTPYRVSLIYPELLVPRSISSPSSHLKEAQGISNRLRETRDLLNGADTLDG